MTIAVRKLSPADVVVHRKNYRGEEQTICVSKLRAYLDRVNHPVSTVPTFQEWAAKFKPDIQPEVLVRIKPNDLRRPILIITELDKKDVVDGKHEYVYAYLTKRLLLPAYVVRPVVWKQYLVKGDVYDHKIQIQS